MQHYKDICVVQVYAPDKLNALMAESDYIVAALPLTPATHKLINAAAIHSMKKSGVFINVGRGQTVDEPALVKGDGQSALPSGNVVFAAVELLWGRGRMVPV